MKYLQILSTVLFLSGCIPEADNADQMRNLLFNPQDLAAPRQVQIHQQDTLLALDWQPVREARYYHVYQSSPGSSGFFRHAINYEAVQTRITGFVPGKTYFFYITAVSRNGIISEPSAVVEIVTAGK